jgi:hypothetical protein
MLIGQWPVKRRRGKHRSRAPRTVVSVAISVALGVTLGAVFAIQGNSITDISQAAFSSHHPRAGFGGRAMPGANTTGMSAVLTAPSFANGPTAFFQLGDLADPVDGMGKAINLNQTPAQAAASMNCTLAVPPSPLSPAGLATPWQLGNGCSMANAATQGAFVEATILAPDGSLHVYNPLVVTAGTEPAVAPRPPRIAPGSTVIIDIGFNGANLVLTGAGAWQGNCVDASGQSVIGQSAACNAVNFYKAANAAIANGTLGVPPAGIALDGLPCLTTRDFALIDQDQSDNVNTKYLINGRGQTAQATAANKAALPGAATLTNGSDNALLTDFVLPANGCTPFTAPNTTNPKGFSPSRALNELSARVNQRLPIAVVPTNDPMTLVGGKMSVTKTNVYRSLVNQPLLFPGTNPANVAASYCQNMVNIAPGRNNLDMARDARFPSPVPAVGNNLATFLGNRLSMSFVNLNCKNFGLTNPVHVTLNGKGVAIAVSYRLIQQVAKGAAISTATTINPQAGQQEGSQVYSVRRHWWQNPSGA